MVLYSEAGCGLEVRCSGSQQGDCPQGHVLEICEDVARMGEDASGTEWAEARQHARRPVMQETVLLTIPQTSTLTPFDI